MAQLLVPAAQYLRMSTDHQAYSLDNQADAIARYAEAHGFSIVKTFSDEARSGLSVARRNGLKQLLRETVEGHHDFKAILVYDVSRWGRFQDADEAAHYEFLCKSSGAPVYYCAETFSHETGFSATILKALKRTMAAEYSRELSTKVRAGQRRLAMLGYKLGGAAPYGLRRMLLDSSGRPKQLLAPGEHKSLVTEHVIFVPGPPDEVAVVQRIFREFTDNRQSMHEIARGLNSDGIPYQTGAKWNALTINRVLRHAAYMGMHVWGRTSTILSGPRVNAPPDTWVTCASAFEPIVGQRVFERAQQVFSSFTHNLTNEQMLERFRNILSHHGKLSGRIIRESQFCPKLNTIRARFGGLNQLYGRLGLSSPTSVPNLLRSRAEVLRSMLIKNIVGSFPNQLQVFRRGPRCRELLKYCKTGLLISILVVASRENKSGTQCWSARCPKCERKRVTILALLNEDNTSINRLLVFRKAPFKHAIVQENSEALRSGIPLGQISDLLNIVHQLRDKLRD